MSSKKMNYVMIAVVSVLTLLVLGVAFFGDSILQSESKKLVETKLQNQVLEAEQQALQRAKADLEKYNELYSIAQEIVPQDKSQAKATREIVALAEKSGIVISGITFPSSELGDKPAGPAPAAASPTAAAPATSSVSQAEPVKGIPGLSQIEISVVSDAQQPISYDQLIDFLQRLENNRRTSQVSALSIQPSPSANSLITFSLTITVYVQS